MHIMRQMSQNKPRTVYPRIEYGHDRSILETLTPKRVARFWAKVDRSLGEYACHPWRGGRNAGGYGLVQGCDDYVGYSFTAHRIAWALDRQAEPGDLTVRHSCDNPPCCNPRHLTIGTVHDNVLDMIERGRANFRGAQGKAGADANAADYSWEDRIEAERLRFDLRWPLADIVAQIGCHRSTVMRWLQDPSRDGRLRLNRRLS